MGKRDVVPGAFTLGTNLGRREVERLVAAFAGYFTGGFSLFNLHVTHGHYLPATINAYQMSTETVAQVLVPR